MAATNIEWTEMTWNPSTGCTKISAGCLNCYAEKMAIRLKAMGMIKYINGFNFSLHENDLQLPFSWKKNRMIFVNSMSDLFHQDMPVEFIQKVFRVMNECSHHTFQVLTKRADILQHYSSFLNWTPNIWIGVTVENEDVMSRINRLRNIPAYIKFLSLEPLLTPLPNLNLYGIDWVIVGGESGPNCRPMKPEWVVDIKNQCEDHGIPFFFKQWGGFNKKINGNLLLGKKYQQLPFQSVTNHSFSG
jgi:protein gp37